MEVAHVLDQSGGCHCSSKQSPVSCSDPLGRDDAEAARDACERATGQKLSFDPAPGRRDARSLLDALTRGGFIQRLPRELGAAAHTAHRLAPTITPWAGARTPRHCQ
jgi:hypothetical protein